VSDEGVSPPDRDQTIAALQALFASSQGQIDARDRVIAMLRAQLARLRRMTFGASSEKHVREIAQIELALEEFEAEAAAVDERVSDAVIKPERPTPFGRCHRTSRAMRSSSSLSPAPAPARRAVASCAVLEPIRTRCSTSRRSAGGWCATFGPSIAATPASSSSTCDAPYRPGDLNSYALADAPSAGAQPANCSVPTSTIPPPPSADSTAPVMNDASSDDRKAMMLAISSGAAMRRSG
jgi:hypothetical protein